MPFSTSPAPARFYHTNQVHFMRKDVAFNTPGIGTASTVVLGGFPANAVIVSAIVKVTAAFNAATTNVLTVGDTTADNTVIAAGDVNEGVVATTIVTAAVGYRFSATADTTLYVRYTQTGTAATAGAAIIMIGYIPANPPVA